LNDPLNNPLNNPTSGDAEALSQQARASMDAHRYEEAVALCDRALAVDDKRVTDWINKGLSLWYLHQNEQAVECYDRAIALNARAALAWMNRANALHDLQRPVAEVMACYDRALEINPELASAWYNKGDELAHMGNFTGAISCFEKARDFGIPDAERLIRRCREIVMSDLNEITP
jgi:tetratricopeptide (TPR) repeat protein